METKKIELYLDFLDKKVEAPVKLFSSYTTNALYNVIWSFYISELA
jgi:hypothetical protein